eukprot:TRINITY_DN829_c2_g1_i1.p1 TRINITY_DN829_c2_g1~~TRINITY_DN829_c2_g1_i1.p1  ORF type:complete len:438 (+),score=154.36 TRINITY_DN829_c2_g1_i1:123-1436(+)
MFDSFEKRKRETEFSRNCLCTSILLSLFLLWFIIETTFWRFPVPPAHTVIARPPVQTLQPDNILSRQPYFIKSMNEFHAKDVTVVVQASPDRFDRVIQMLRRWKGPMSLALYMRNETFKEDSERIKKIYYSSSLLQEWLDIHLVFRNQTRYPVNVLRNEAIRHARTEYIFILDADFVPNAGLRQQLHKILREPNLEVDELIVANSKDNKQKMNTTLLFKHGKTKKERAFVVPAFDARLPVLIQDLENTHTDDDIIQQLEETTTRIANTIFDPLDVVPEDKVDLLASIINKHVFPVNERVCPKCHGPVNYSYYYSAKRPYSIIYHWIFEPYVVLRKALTLPLFEERLKGYGFDKNSHALTLALHGYEFVVLPHSFAMHLPHKRDPSSWEGPNLDQQQWDALKILCAVIPELKTKLKIPTDYRVFDEPIGEECYSDRHW